MEALGVRDPDLDGRSVRGRSGDPEPTVTSLTEFQHDERHGARIPLRPSPSRKQKIGRSSGISVS